MIRFPGRLVKTQLQKPNPYSIFLIQKILFSSLFSRSKFRAIKFASNEFPGDANVFGMGTIYLICYSKQIYKDETSGKGEGGSRNEVVSVNDEIHNGE